MSRRQAAFNSSLITHHSSLFSPPPLELVSQNVEVVARARLDEIEGRAALADADAVFVFERDADLTVERERDLLLRCLQNHLELDRVLDDERAVRERVRA